MRENENPLVLGPMNDTSTVAPSGKVSAKPPNYSDLFDASGSSLASTPPRYSSKTPSVEISSSNEQTQPAAAASTKPKIIKPRKMKKQKSEDEVKIMIDNETA